MTEAVHAIGDRGDTRALAVATPIDQVPNGVDAPRMGQAISRRSLMNYIVKAPLAVAVSGLTVRAAVAGQMLPESEGRIARLIEAHAAALDAFHDAINVLELAEDKADARPVRVQCGRRYIHDVPPEERPALYVTTVGELRQHADQHAGIVRAFGRSEREVADARARFLAPRVAELHRLKRERIRRLKAAGYYDAERTWRAADRVELAARAALLVERPSSEAEAALKRNYFETCNALSGGDWNGNDERWDDALFEAACRPMPV